MMSHDKIKRSMICTLADLEMSKTVGLLSLEFKINYNK